MYLVSCVFYLNVYSNKLNDRTGCAVSFIYANPDSGIDGFLYVPLIERIYCHFDFFTVIPTSLCHFDWNEVEWRNRFFKGSLDKLEMTSCSRWLRQTFLMRRKNNVNDQSCCTCHSDFFTVIPNANCHFDRSGEIS